jgi:hypothetical protein
MKTIVDKLDTETSEEEDFCAKEDLTSLPALLFWQCRLHILLIK